MWAEAVILAVWLGAMSLVTLVVAREAGLMRARVALVGAAMGHGPEVGALVPRELRASPGVRRVVLFLSGGCPSCHQLAAEIAAAEPDNLLAIVTGEGDDVEELARSLPTDLPAVTGVQAQTIAERSGVHVQPFAIAVEGSLVVGKAFPTGVVSLRQLGRAES